MGCHCHHENVATYFAVSASVAICPHMYKWHGSFFRHASIFECCIQKSIIHTRRPWPNEQHRYLVSIITLWYVYILHILRLSRWCNHAWFANTKWCSDVYTIHSIMSFPPTQFSSGLGIMLHFSFLLSTCTTLRAYCFSSATIADIESESMAAQTSDIENIFGTRQTVVVWEGHQDFLETIVSDGCGIRCLEMH